MKKPLVSICIPVFNADAFIETTLNSVISQTYKELEILIVDDGSTDSSLEIIESLNDKRIKILQQQNLGAAYARNLALRHAKGEFIQFLDADDILSKDKISEQVAALAHTKKSIAVCKTIFFYNEENPFLLNGQLGQEQFLFSTKKPIEFLLNLWGLNSDNKHGMIQTNAWLTSKELIEETGYWSEFYSPDDDGEYFCRVLSLASEVIYTPNCFNYYRKFSNRDSLSSRNSHKALSGIYKSLINKEAALINKVERKTLEKVIKRQFFELLYHAYGFYPDIVADISVKYPELLKMPYAENIGGTAINLIKNIFGWRFAKRLQTLKYSRLNNMKIIK